MATIDLNLDVGEHYGVYRYGEDEALMPYVSSVNIACGMHAGDPQVMAETVRLALKYNLSIGAHPGLPDREGFGRRWIDISPREIYHLVIYQIGALDAFVRAQGAHLSHVKAHGALYNRAAFDEAIATAVAEAVRDVDHTLLLYALAGSVLIEIGEAMGLHMVREGFADRAYTPDGMLVSRKLDGAVHRNPETIKKQALQLARREPITTWNGTSLHIDVDSICLHGDTPGNVEASRMIYEALTAEGIDVRPPAQKSSEIGDGHV
ncbi:MAG: 5-oxoprolinase subunit PxpA [Candidatus Carbobacillus sp.]|nr:5-oxoprolinase subunit PxpA [Candidatus Carbobacillus sp.]